MTDAHQSVLEKTIQYSGERLSVKSLEEDIASVRGQQNVQVADLKTLREQNVQLQTALGDEIKKLRKFSDYLTGETRQSFWANLKEVLSYVPGLRGLGITRRSIQELLRQQYEISARRVKEAAEFSDKLKSAEADLFDEIERLNGKILEAARNEDVAAEYVLELKAAIDAMQGTHDAAEQGSTIRREIQASIDQARRLLSEHSTQLQLYHTSEERIARLKENTGKLRETIGNLGSDITQYVTAASEKLDIVAGQIQAIGTAADASVVMLELKKSLDVMTESMNETTQFVSQTQAFFRQNLDNLMQELEIYDDKTRAMMDENLAMSREVDDRRIAEAVKVALERREAPAGA